MKVLVPLVIAVLPLFAATSFAQVGTPGVQVPGAPRPGAQAPGMPPRDNNRAAPQTGTAVIRGRVVSQPTGQPLRRAQITLTGGEPGPGQLRRVTTTNAEGRYEFIQVPAGRFTLSAAKAGYVTLQFGQRRPFEEGTPVTVSEGQAIDAGFVLPRGSVIVVRITDEFGEPVAGAMVRIQRFQYGPDGRRRPVFAQTSMPGIGATSTDDRGELRVYGLSPGDYIVEATTSLAQARGTNAGDATEGFVTTYYPGVLTPGDAQAISVGVGEEKPVQFSMVVSRLVSVSGRVADSQGRPAAQAALSLVTFSGSGMSSSGLGQARPDGTFEAGGIAPGEYTLRVTLPRLGTTGESAMVPITVGTSDIKGLDVTLGPGAMVTGRVLFDGGEPRLGPTPPRVSLQQADGRVSLFGAVGSGSDPIDTAGNFSVTGASGTVFLNVTPMPPGWTIKSVVVDGMDITDVPLDLDRRASVSDVVITVTDKPAVVSGSVTDGRGLTLREYVVVIQGAEQKEPVVASRFVRRVRPDTSGRFEVRGLRPGRYLATALEALEQGREFSPEFRQQLRQAPGTREFTLGEGQSVTVDVRLTPGL